MSASAASPRVEGIAAAAPTGTCSSPAVGAATSVWKNICGYAAAACAAMITAAIVLHLSRAHLSVPLFYDKDALPELTLLHNVQDSGWFLDNPRLGAPGVLDVRDYPMADALHFGIAKALLCVFHNPMVVYNLLLLLPFPVTALSAYFVFRRLRLGRLAALVPSVLYSCSAYHFLRMQLHPFLASYYLLPPMIWLALRVSLGRNPLRPRLWSWQAAGAILLCILTGIAGVYYAFFSCFFLLAAGMKSAVRERRWTPLGASALLAFVIAASLAAGLAPSLIHFAQHGQNAALARLPGEADLFGMKIGELLLPTADHHNKGLAHIVDHYISDPVRRPTGEWRFETLGVVAAVGFLYLIGRFLLRRRDKVERAEDGLAFLNVTAVLLGTVGGLGCVFAFWVSPMIRCYGRLSICIAFFALAGLFLTLQRIAERYVRGQWTRTAWTVGLLALLGVGAYDQTSAVMRPSYTETRRQFDSDRDFGRRIETLLPPGSMVYEMPYVPFPENPPVCGLADYELLRPLFHTRTLRWSYGTVKGGNTDFWQAELAKLPMPELVETLAFAGFRGIYLDRRGFADGAAQAEEELSCLLDVAPQVSRTGQQSFFDMSGYIESLRSRYSDAEWEDRKAELLPVELRWAVSFLPPEHNQAEGAWRWCGPDGDLHVVNPLDRPQRVVLKMECSGLWDQTTPSHLVLSGAGGRRDLVLTAQRQPLEIVLSAAPGDNTVHFSCDGRRLSADVGVVVFRLWDVTCRTEK
ncbi:MAG TPA: hypothetical protein VMS17_32175 [Gemmataceae bacterium]|nr:hypothetical protein [Gemmataceae bacterium]